MTPFLFYLLKVTVCSGLLFGYYWLVLRNKVFHQYNRFYLLAITLLSILLPLLQISFSFKDKNTQQIIQYISVSSADESFVISTKQSAYYLISLEQWMIILYAAISGLLLILTLRAAIKIVKILQSHPKQCIGQVIFLACNAPGTPFSFFNYLVWNQKIDFNSKTGQHIFQHELAHIREKHTIDKVFLLAILIPFWINPIFWFIRKELNSIHEFLADSKAVEGSSAEDLSKMILNVMYPQHLYLFTSPFFQSPVKRRLQMFSLKNQKLNYMSRILVLPFVFMVTVAFSVKTKTSIFDAAANTAFNPVKTNINEQIGNKDTIPSPSSRTLFADTKNDIYLFADTIIYKSGITRNAPAPMDALIIINGNKVNHAVLKENIIEAGEIIFYEKGNAEAKSKYGADAANGVIVMRDATVQMKKDNAFYKNLKESKNKTTTDQTVIVTNQPIFTQVEVEAQFPVDPGWQTFLQKNLDAATPVNHGAPAGHYPVSVQFTVAVDGKISDIKALTAHGYGMEAEVVKLMTKSPNWVPAMQNGRKVKSIKIQKVTFVVSEGEAPILSAHNKLYIGIDNPIKLQVGNPETQHVIVTITNGSITKSGALYIARVNQKLPVTIKVGINENGTIKPVASRTFEADVIKYSEDVKKVAAQIQKFSN